MLIKAITSGKMCPVAVDGSDLKNYASAFKSYRNKTKFLTRKYNEAGVMNNIEDGNLCIFLDSDFDANFDVNVLASAFNMDKADFVGRRFLIDDWTTFDNERWEVIRQNTISALKGDTTGVVEPITAEELALMADVKSVMIDDRWFQVYESVNMMKEKEVASGLYWNYFYHNWKIVAHSPFSVAIVFVDNSATITTPSELTATVTAVDKVSGATVVNVNFADAVSLAPSDVQFEQTEALTEAGVAVQKYGTFIIPKTALAETFTVSAKIKDIAYATAEAVTLGGLAVGDTITLAKQS